jgi:hypothetical protein|tara:strand:+ start:165 stop:338 length:174 start_codon:yes stop_codon:yes gene_type:complete
MSVKQFGVTMLVTVEKNNNILSSYEDAHEDDVRDMIVDTFYDVDDIEVKNLVVKERL